MAKLSCGACSTEITSGRSIIMCARCDGWFHMACFGMKQNKLVNKANLIFLCDPCLESQKRIWSEENVEKEEAETQKEEVAKIVKVKEMAVQTEKEARKKEGHEPPTQNPTGEQKKETKKTVKMARREFPVRIIGDSMVKRMTTQVRCNVEGGGCTSMSGARISDVRQKIVEEAPRMRDGLLVIQGGGNGLGYVGEEETISNVVEAVKAVEGKGMSVAVVGVLRRPREGRHYESRRRATNKKLHERIADLKVEWLREKKGNISFLDMDSQLKEDRFYAADGIHLNEAGNARMGARLREWVRARSLCPVDQV